jgi:hypothetical protein
MTAAAPRWGATARATVRAVAGHPSLWPVAASSVFRLARRGWWRRWPPVPLPDEAYWRFRLETAYGGTRPDSDPSADDVRSYLRWCRRARTTGG